MSKIKNDGLDQYGAEPFQQQQCGTAGVERVNITDRHTRLVGRQSLSPTADHNGTVCIVRSPLRPCCGDNHKSRVPRPQPPPLLQQTTSRRDGQLGTATRARYTCIVPRRPHRPGRSRWTPAEVCVVFGAPVDASPPHCRRRLAEIRSKSVAEQSERQWQ